MKKLFTLFFLLFVSLNSVAEKHSDHRTEYIQFLVNQDFSLSGVLSSRTSESHSTQWPEAGYLDLYRGVQHPQHVKICADSAHSEQAALLYKNGFEHVFQLIEPISQITYTLPLICPKDKDFPLASHSIQANNALTVVIHPRDQRKSRDDQWPLLPSDDSGKTEWYIQGGGGGGFPWWGPKGKPAFYPESIVPAYSIEVERLDEDLNAQIYNHWLYQLFERTALFFALFQNMSLSEVNQWLQSFSDQSEPQLSWPSPGAELRVTLRRGNQPPVVYNMASGEWHGILESLIDGDSSLLRNWLDNRLSHKEALVADILERMDTLTADRSSDRTEALKEAERQLRIVIEQNHTELNLEFEKMDLHRQLAANRLPEKLTESITQAQGGKGQTLPNPGTGNSGSGAQGGRSGNVQTDSFSKPGGHEPDDKKSNEPPTPPGASKESEASDSTPGFVYTVDHTDFTGVSGQSLTTCDGCGKNTERLEDELKKTENKEKTLETAGQSGLLEKEACNTLLFPSAYQTDEGHRICEDCRESILNTAVRAGMNRDKAIEVFGYKDKAVTNENGNLDVTCSDCLQELKLKDCDEHAQLHNFNCLDCQQTIHAKMARTHEDINEAREQHQDANCRMDCPHCQESINGKEFRQHQLTCASYSQNCPVGGCSFEGIFDDLLNHMVSSTDTAHRVLPCFFCDEQIPCYQFMWHTLAHTTPNTCPDCSEQPPSDRCFVQHIKEKHPEAYRRLIQQYRGREVADDKWGRFINLITADNSGAFETVGTVEVIGELQEKLNMINWHSKQMHEASQELSNLQEAIATLTGEFNTLKTRQTSRADNAQRDNSATMRRTNEADVNEIDIENRVASLENRMIEKMKELAKVKVLITDLELQLQAAMAATYNGSFLWRVPDVKRRRREAIDGKITSIYSPPFYTGRNGYKMCIRAYLNGDGIGYNTHLSIFFVLMKGEYDPFLKWPFDYKVSLILADPSSRRHMVQTFKPSPGSSSFQRPKSDMNIASGCPKFAELKVLDNEDYVEDDVLYIKAIVDTTRIFHP